MEMKTEKRIWQTAEIRAHNYAMACLRENEAIARGELEESSIYEPYDEIEDYRDFCDRCTSL
jgi:hypothetical protein